LVDLKDVILSVSEESPSFSSSESNKTGDPSLRSG